jgi:class 3 adenylate cyclase
MPGLGGIEVLKQLKADAGLRNIPVIVISGVEDITSVVQCIELGAEDYLSKPFNPVILRARIGASLEKRRLRKLEASQLAQILLEQKKSDELLNVVLPAAAARELKATGAVAPHRHDRVAVLFCDIVGFTAYCDRHAAEDVVSRLQALIERFEEITEQHQMEKIKTIGDAFMATAGMLVPNSNPLASATRCGLDMISAAGEVTKDWQVRVGVNCGPMISGVLGRRRYQFDAWGSAINVAARMTAFASPGTVAMTRAASLQLGSEFVMRPLGRKEVKGLGFMELFECYGIAVQQG